MKGAKAQDVVLLVLRIALGLTMMYYGSMKAFGLFEGRGFEGQLSAFEANYGIPRHFGILAIVAEFGGGLGLLFGLLTPVAAFGVMCTMLVAAYVQITKPGAIAAIPQGRVGDIPAFGWPIALALIAFTILVLGPGKMALDKKLFKKGKAKA